MSQLEDRITRMEDKWIEADVKHAEILIRIGYFKKPHYNAEEHEALERVIYWEDKLIKLLVEAQKQGELTQAQVDEQIWLSVSRFTREGKAQKQAVLNGTV